ncbi:MAG TPA: DUF308 domain-containing protein [Gemmatimonadaceae bacterium]
MFVLARNWWVLAVRGALAVLFGIIAFAWPAVTVAAFVLLFGAYALLDGITALVAAFRPPPSGSRAMLVLCGLLGVAAAIVVFLRPQFSAVVLLVVIAVWAVLTGLAEIGIAIALRKVVTGEWLLALSGVLSVLLGAFLLARPGAGLLGLVWAIAAWAIVYGVMLILLAFRLRAWFRAGGVSFGGGRMAGA